MTKKPPGVRPAYMPARFDPNGYTTRALQALAAGVASAEQQKHALQWIINDVALTYDQPYRPGVDGDRETAFACGRQHVGQQIVSVMKRTIEQKEKV